MHTDGDRWPLSWMSLFIVLIDEKPFLVLICVNLCASVVSFFLPSA